MENSEEMERTAFQRACASLGHGGQTKLARHLGVTPQAVQKMCARGKPPKKRVPAIASFLGVPEDDLSQAA